MYVDLYGTTSIEGFIRSLIKGAIVIEPKGSRFIKLIRETISGYSAYGGLVAGHYNTIEGNYSIVSGGYYNDASANYSVVP